MTMNTSDGIRERHMRDLGYDVGIGHIDRGRVIVAMSLRDLDQMLEHLEAGITQIVDAAPSSDDADVDDLRDAIATAISALEAVA
jgi:hypothetical protein